MSSTIVRNELNKCTVVSQRSLIRETEFSICNIVLHVPLF